jgi:hypothetical protein
VIRKILLGVLVLAAAALLATRGIPSPTPNPPGTFSFAVLGDAPYYALHGEGLRFRLVLQEIDAHDLAFVIHVGDIFWQPCSDAQYRETLDQFNALRHPVTYTPGDNEWTDCWEEVTGSYDPLERLARLREIFFANPAQSLGQRRIAVVTQGRGEPFAEFVENVRWTHQGVLFTTVHLPGSANAREPFPGRTATHNEAATRRTNAAVAWLREAFADARTSAVTAVVVAFHASPDLELPPDGSDSEYRRHFEPFITALEEEVEQFGKPVVVAHGDGHTFTVDRPLVRRTTGRVLDNMTRLQVPGSPDVGWVRVVVKPGPDTTFAFENRVVPFWKVW